MLVANSNGLLVQKSREGGAGPKKRRDKWGRRTMERWIWVTKDKRSVVTSSKPYKRPIVGHYISSDNPYGPRAEVASRTTWHCPLFNRVKPAVYLAPIASGTPVVKGVDRS